MSIALSELSSDTTLDLVHRPSPDSSSSPNEITRPRELNSLIPINKIPFEILATIFELACKRPFPPELDSDSDDWPPTLSDSDTIMLYTLPAVCHTWRRTMLNLPALWRTIPVPLELKLPSRYQLVDLHCSRSGSHPIGLSTTVLEPHEHEQLMHELAIRDRNLDVMDWSAELTERFRAFRLCQLQYQGVVGSLHDLTLRFQNGLADFVKAIDLTGSTALVNLRILFSRWELPESWRGLEMPRLQGVSAPHLQSFHLFGVFDPRDIKTLLQTCANSLKTLYWHTGELLDDDFVPEHDYPPVNSIYLPHLTSLSCRGVIANSLLIHIAASETLETLKFCKAGHGFFDPAIDTPQRYPSHLNANLLTQKIPSLRNVVIGWAPDVSAYPYVRAQKRLETLCSELWRLGDLFNNSPAQSLQELDRTLFPDLRRVYVDFDAVDEEEFDTLKGLLEMSACRRRPFLVFIFGGGWEWWDELIDSANENERNTRLQYSHIVYRADWDPWDSHFDPKKVLREALE